MAPFVNVVYWCPCMAMNVIIQFNSGFLTDILRLTQAPIVVWLGGIIIVNHVLSVLSFVLLCRVAWHGD